jgi:hypothetical protein
MGATGTRLSLRPLIFEGHELQTSDASRREKADVCLDSPRHCERSEAIQSCFFIALWIASLALALTALAV